MRWLLLSLIFLSGCSDPSSVAADEPILEVTELRGVVVDEAINPIADARIQIAGLDAEVRSNENGGFSLDADAGTYLLTAHKEGYAASQVEGSTDAKITITMVRNQTTEPFVVSTNWEGFIACSLRVGVPQLGQSAGVNACNGVAEQDVEHLSEFPSGAPTWFQTELVWESTQIAGDELRYTIGDASCLDSKEWWGEAGPSPVVIAMDSYAVNARSLDADSDACVRVFAYTSGTLQHVLGAQLQQRFSTFDHAFYHMEPPAGWTFALDGPL